jgi:hypothetical protein
MRKIVLLILLLSVFTSCEIEKTPVESVSGSTIIIGDSLNARIQRRNTLFEVCTDTLKFSPYCSKYDIDIDGDVINDIEVCGNVTRCNYWFYYRNFWTIKPLSAYVKLLFDTVDIRNIFNKDYYIFSLRTFNKKDTVSASDNTWLNTPPDFPASTLFGDPYPKGRFVLFDSPDNSYPEPPEGLVKGNISGKEFNYPDVKYIGFIIERNDSFTLGWIKFSCITNYSNLILEEIGSANSSSD